MFTYFFEYTVCQQCYKRIYRIQETGLQDFFQQTVIERYGTNKAYIVILYNNITCLFIHCVKCMFILGDISWVLSNNASGHWFTFIGNHQIVNIYTGQGISI